MPKLALFFLALLFLFSGGMVLYNVYIRTEQVSIPESEENKEDWLTKFTLTDQYGQEFDSQQLDGQVWVGSFFFSRCPTTCFEQNQRVAELQKDFAGRGLKLVSITCEPDYDTPARLTAYADKFNADHQHWHFLTGDDLNYILRIAAEIMQISVQAESHSDRLVLFDAEGNRVDALRARDVKDFAKLRKTLDEMLPKTKAEEVVPEDS